MFDILKIIDWFKRNFSKKDIFLIIILIAAYFLTRLINLDRFPIFSDEGIYIRWAKVAWHDASWRFISLTDGKQPLQTWATIPFLKFFPGNALLAGRLFAVFSGFLGLAGIFSLTYYLFGKRASYIASFFYIINPYFLFYDRLALVDSLVNASSLWIFLFSILLITTLRLDIALLFGLISGLALLAKSSVRIFLSLSFFSPLYLLGKKLNLSINKALARRILNFFILYSAAAFLAFVIYNVQRLSPFFHYVEKKNLTFIMSPQEFLKSPFSVLYPNIKAIPLYIFSEMSYFLPFLGLFGLYLLFRKKREVALYISSWIFLSYFLIALFSKVIYPRYLIFLGSFLAILAAYLLDNIKTKKNLVGVLVLSILSVAYFNYTVWFDYKKIPFPEVDRGQYLEGWPAGWGAKEIVEYARAKSKEKPVILMAEGNFGMSGDVLDVFLHEGDKITISGFWPLNEEHILDSRKFLKDNQVFIVFSHRSEFPIHWPIKLIKKYEKPGGKSAIYLYELL